MTSASWMNVSTPPLSNSTFTTVGGGASRPERHAYIRVSSSAGPPPLINEVVVVVVFIVIIDLRAILAGGMSR